MDLKAMCDVPVPSSRPQTSLFIIFLLALNSKFKPHLDGPCVGSFSFSAPVFLTATYNSPALSYSLIPDYDSCAVPLCWERFHWILGAECRL